MNEAQKHNEKVLAEIATLEAKIKELRGTIKDMGEVERIPLHVLNAAKRAKPVEQSKTRKKAAAKKEAE